MLTKNLSVFNLHVFFFSKIITEVAKAIWETIKSIVGALFGFSTSQNQQKDDENEWDYFKDSE